MKIKLLLTLFLSFAFINFISSQEKSSVILETAFKQAKTEHKNVLVIFHASWCGWCKKLDANVNDKACKDLFDSNFVITHLTVQESEQNKNLENPGATDLFNKYGNGNSGVPFFLVFDGNGKLLRKSVDENGSNLGCPANEHEVEVLIDILKETTKLKKPELEVIRNKFLTKENAG